MTQPLPDSPPTAPEPFPQGGLTPDAKIKALHLQARLLSGEEVPLDEIKEFLINADFDLEKTKVKRSTIIKKEDVDFF